MHRDPLPRSRVSRVNPLGLAALGLGLALAALAQQQLNPQLNTEVYGRGVGSVRQGGLSSLPNQPFYQPTLASDWRHQAVLSGALRSDIRGEALLQGRLSPGGSLSYIPQSPRPFGEPRPYGSTASRAPAAVRPPAARSLGGTRSSVPSGAIRQPTSSVRTGLVVPPRAPTGPAPGVAPPPVKPPLVDMSYGSMRYSR